ncbi:choice-of-anchor L domain-containing protein [Microbacterium sp. NPDC076895]|uniref:choice-of-anchor L domain-containing protein n=1 Tax=Microbacterium sp. NPDC076895 TaxID=3154957 RepID=UPI003428560E
MVPAASASAAPSGFSDAMDVPGGDVWSVTTAGSANAVAVSSAPFASFPRAGGSYVVLSTGNAADVVGGSPDTFLSTELGAASGADGNDLSQLLLELTPPAEATCLAVDFQFLSEEYPEYVGSEYNDIFTAELGESHFEFEGSQVIARNNFAYDSDGNFISINTVLGFHDATGTAMDGTTDPLVAVTPLETDINTGRVTAIFSIQDIGDSIYDSAVLLDNFRWLYGENCERTVASLSDSDGDGLPDDWEENGIDYDGDGDVEVDLAALGADSQRADIFLEIDWMEKPPTCLLFLCWGAKNFSPDRAALGDVVDAFAAAPYDNPDGSTGITLHLDAGIHSPGANLGGGNPVAWVGNLGSTAGGVYDWTAFESLKEANFASLRSDVFHYVVYADRYGGGDSSGISRGIPGADLVVADGAWSGGFTRIQERGTLMHELGHNLDLKHGGVDHTTYQYDSAYRSVMNYLYQLVGLTPGARLDYSRGAPFDDWANIRFDGGSIGDLGETAPILATEDDIEITPEIANELDIAAIDGDGAIEVLGPNVFGAGRAGQVVNVRVINPGSSRQTYTVNGSVAGLRVPSVDVTVDAASTRDTALVFDASALSAGEVELLISLDSEALGDGIDDATAVLTGLDLTDSEVRDGLAADAAAAALYDEPPASSVLATLTELSDGNEQPEPTATNTPSPEPTPSPASTGEVKAFLQLSALTVSPGETLELTGTGFPAQADVRVELHSTPKLLGTTVTSASGAFVLEVTVPASTTPGQHSIVVRAESVTVSTPLTVSAASSLAASGSDMAPWVALLGMMFVGVGGSLVATQTGRRARS